MSAAQRMSFERIIPFFLHQAFTKWLQTKGVSQVLSVLHWETAVKFKGCSLMSSTRWSNRTGFFFSFQTIILWNIFYATTVYQCFILLDFLTYVCMDRRHGFEDKNYNLNWSIIHILLSRTMDLGDNWEITLMQSVVNEGHFVWAEGKRGNLEGIDFQKHTH